MTSPGAFLGRARRHVEQRADQLMVLGHWAFSRASDSSPIPFDGETRFALLTVNFSTTRYLKLMLATLAEQDDPGLVRTLVVCDNASRDGAETFLQQLTAHVPEAVVVRNRHFLSHARGMRRALKALQDSEAAVPVGDRANVILFCDTDVIFRDSATMRRLADVFDEHDAAFAGEFRRHLFPYPEAQASFLAVRRDWLEDPSAMPWVNHGSPAYWLQRSLWRHGGVGVDFPSNRGGFILHRGRSGVAAASSFRPGHSYSTVANRDPHYMGVPDGARIWSDAEERFGDLLAPEREEALAVLIGLALSGPG